MVDKREPRKGPSGSRSGSSSGVPTPPLTTTANRLRSRFLSPGCMPLSRLAALCCPTSSCCLEDKGSNLITRVCHADPTFPFPDVQPRIDATSGAIAPTASLRPSQIRTPWLLEAVYSIGCVCSVDE
jgi:hypothetical protein